MGFVEPPTGFAGKAGQGARRFFVGIGVGAYDDATLDLPQAESDVVKVADWFTRKSGLAHILALEQLGQSPSSAQVTESLRGFLKGLSADDVVVIYVACHGELEGSRAYLFGRDTPREGLAGAAVEAGTLGAIVGQSKPHNVLLIIDACVAGKLASAIQRAAEDTSDELANRDPHRPISLVVLSSTYGRDPAYDGRFAEAFLRVVSEERWTGTTSRWIDIGQLIRGLNEELKDIAPTQIAELRAWVTNVAELIPNPNVAARQLGRLIADEEFQAHFDPSARGVARGEAGSFFTGRVHELRRMVRWFEGEAESSMLVITGSPGCGKSALLARAAVLCDPAHRPDDTTLATLAQGTVPAARALDAVVWCHNKTERQIIEEIAGALGGSASTPDALLRLASGRRATIAIDALDETQEGTAPQVARRVLEPVARVDGIRLLVATRRRPVGHSGSDGADLLGQLGAQAAAVIDLDQSPDARADMRDYVRARIRATSADTPVAADMADQIAQAAGRSFLVAAIAARSAAAGRLSRRSDGSYLLPTEVGAALSAYIDALPDPTRARGLLRALAWSQGAGLPWGSLWPHLATALSRVAEAPGMTYGDDDVGGLLDAAGDLVVESVQAGQPVYRLFHEALAEHLRADTQTTRAHDVLAQAMRELVDGRSWPQAQSYITGNLATHLLGAGRLEELVDLLIDPGWDRAIREQTGDPLAAVGFADAAIERLLVDSQTDLRAVALCFAYSRAMTTAPPLILDVLARSGQLARAEMMANNLAYAPDRMLAYRYLCEAYGRERDRGAARRCYEEAHHALPAMPQVHRAMAWCWLVEAAMDGGLAGLEEPAAKAAVDAAFAIEGDGWDLPNGYFWAAKACARAGWAPGLVRIRAGLDALSPGIARRNQSLQAASVAGHREFLVQRLAEYLKGAHFPQGMLRDGNLALALVDAGLDAQAAQVFDQVGEGDPKGAADSNKRWVWALAQAGRQAQAQQAMVHVHDPIEQGKAIARIASIARMRKDEESLKALLPLVKPLLDGAEPRSRARLIRVLWLVGERAEALSLAEQEIATGHSRRWMADPRDGIGPQSEQVPPLTGSLGPKVRKREMASSVVMVADQLAGWEAESEAASGKLDLAREHVEKVTVPLFRARALAAIAKHDPHPEQAVADWLRAMQVARRAGRGVVEEIWSLGLEVLERKGQSAEGRALGTHIQAIDARWDLESFSEQYEALRKAMAPGADRTGRMGSLLLVPRRLSRGYPWTHEELRAAWRSGQDGKRLFVLGLIQGNAALADAEVLVQGIRSSRSAFEQYNALVAAEGARLAGEEANALLAAVQEELRGDPRPDGVESGIKPGSGRMVVATRLLAQLQACP
jgi:hypothetical protein